LPSHLKKTVVLVGMMGAGKTAVGTALARSLGVPFLDSDAEIEHAANMSISEIFARDGEEFFRRKETQVIERLLHGRPGILSTGGGAFMREGNRKIIADHGVSVWLKASLDVLWNRVRHKDTRPLLKTPDPYGTLKALAETREPVYAQADLVIESAADQAVEDMSQKVLRALQGHPGVFGKK
jgi:shikimate kinase